MAGSFVIIPTHERKEITTVNIRRFDSIEVVAVVSTNDELKYYSKLGCHVVMAQNNPLGAKFQAGVDYAKNFDPDYIMPLGSDDLLDNYFIPRYLQQWPGFSPNDEYVGLTGFSQWYVWSDDKLYLLEYLAEQPLGGARIFPRGILKSLNYKLFDTTKNRLLDDYAWNQIKDKYGQRIINEPHILAVKGNWPVMNPVDLKHRNVKLLQTYSGEEALKIMKEKFNYIP